MKFCKNFIILFWITYVMSQLIQNRPDGATCKGNIHCINKCCLIKKADTEGVCVTPPAGTRAVCGEQVDDATSYLHQLLIHYLRQQNTQQRNNALTGADTRHQFITQGQPYGFGSFPGQLVTTASQGTTVTGAFVYVCSTCDTKCCCGTACCDASVCTTVGTTAATAITGTLCTGCNSLCCCGAQCCAASYCGLPNPGAPIPPVQVTGVAPVMPQPPPPLMPLPAPPPLPLQLPPPVPPPAAFPIPQIAPVPFPPQIPLPFPMPASLPLSPSPIPLQPPPFPPQPPPIPLMPSFPPAQASFQPPPSPLMQPFPPNMPQSLSPLPLMDPDPLAFTYMTQVVQPLPQMNMGPMPSSSFSTVTQQGAFTGLGYPYLGGPPMTPPSPPYFSRNGAPRFGPAFNQMLGSFGTGTRRFGPRTRGKRHVWRYSPRRQFQRWGSCNPCCSDCLPPIMPPVPIPMPPPPPPPPMAICTNCICGCCQSYCCSCALPLQPIYPSIPPPAAIVTTCMGCQCGCCGQQCCICQIVSPPPPPPPVPMLPQQPPCLNCMCGCCTYQCCVCTPGYPAIPAVPPRPPISPFPIYPPSVPPYGGMYVAVPYTAYSPPQTASGCNADCRCGCCGQTCCACKANSILGAAFDDALKEIRKAKQEAKSMIMKKKNYSYT